MGRARKPEPADSQILDDQAVPDIQESGTSPVLDQLIGDGPDELDDDDETARSRTIELTPDDLTETLSLKELAELAAGSDTSEAATMDQHDPPKK